MDDLHVENYDEKKVVTKKRSIAKRIKLGGAFVLTLSLFGLSGCACYATPGGAGSWYNSITEVHEQTTQTKDKTEITNKIDLHNNGADKK